MVVHAADDGDAAAGGDEVHADTAGDDGVDGRDDGEDAEGGDGDDVNTDILGDSNDGNADAALMLMTVEMLIMMRC